MFFEYLIWRSNKRQERKLDELIDPSLPPTTVELEHHRRLQRLAGWCVFIGMLAVIIFTSH